MVFYLFGMFVLIGMRAVSERFQLGGEVGVVLGGESLCFLSALAAFHTTPP
jgi:hypothetical protein